MVIMFDGGFMLFNLVDLLQRKRRLFFIVAFIIFDIWLLLICNQTLQSHRADMTLRIQNYETIQALPAYRREAINGNSILGNAVDATEIGTYRVLIATSDGISKTEQTIQAASKATNNAVSSAVNTTTQSIKTAATTTTNGMVRSVGFTIHVYTMPFVAAGQGIGAASHATSTQLASVIQPKKDIASVPVITPEQAQQATIIQSGTLEVKPVAPIGSGGACDNGAGNGGYPMEWCDAPMDSIRTVSYSGDRINRECTSYAYWYFTAIEGHTDFHVTGNANRWAYTSNYPIHTTPAVGAIAVETHGYYGHVAIVQGLPGQTHDGKVVPEGYVLVSEMNYDWHGHFRYSYSPLSKFSAYIYP